MSSKLSKYLGASVIAMTALSSLPQFAHAQGVPISVTVVSPAQLEKQGVASIEDLSSVASGFNIQSSQTESQGRQSAFAALGQRVTISA